MLFKIVHTFILLSCVFLTSCKPFSDTEVVRISGQTMGTTYNVVTVGGTADLDEVSLRTEVETVFADVNSKMSNWDGASEISRFNQSRQTAPVKISSDLFAVMVEANNVHAISKGKFDVTLGPLIDLWGFGSRKPETPFPSKVQIAQALENVGQHDILSLDTSEKTLTKLRPDVQINLSALAKGFGIDAVAEKLTELGYENFLVEVGGDLRTAGRNERNKSWRVGIEKPQTDAREVKKILTITDMGMATSGDYRNFVETGGKRFSHILDPSTGRPVSHLTTSVTVIADNAMKADAWATALLVLGERAGLQLANENGIAAFFIFRDRNLGEQQYVTVSSHAFEKLDKAH